MAARTKAASDNPTPARVLLIALGLTCALIQLACGARPVPVVGDAGPRCAWRPLAIGLSTNVTKIWGTAADDVYVSADHGVVMHFDGARWSRLALPTDFPGEPFHTVIAPGQGGPLLLRAAVAKRQGNRWTSLAKQHVGCQPVGGIETTAGKVFVGCWDGDIYQISDGQWSRVYQGGSYLVAFWETPNGTLLASGGTGNVLRFDGTRWAEIPTEGDAHQDIWAASDDVFYVISGSVEYGRVYRYRGLEKTLALDSALPWGTVGIWGSSATDIHVAGRGFWHFDGVSWERLRYHPDDGYTRVWGSGPENVYAGGSLGRFLHYTCRPE